MQFENNLVLSSKLYALLQHKQKACHSNETEHLTLQSGLKSRIKKMHAVASSNVSNTWLAGAKQALPDPMDSMNHCRMHLQKLDMNGWTRSYHQRLFHEDFLKACTRSFFKLHAAGSFARAHARILRANSWNHLAQEILISTPRRFGKTISVSMFCAALLCSCPGVEISIYSTCKRISQKILRNVLKFCMLICDQFWENLHMESLRENMEELNIRGPYGQQDVRIINSYPSKVIFKCCEKVEHQS